MDHAVEAGEDGAQGSWFEVLIVFLRLGLTSFGGPIAHIGYFRDQFVTRRRWLGEAAFADLVALCQFLPGPASSQVGFAIGLTRAGALGGLAAWTGFTLPSAVLMTAFALGSASLSGPLGLGLAHGLKLVAVAVVAQALLGMARSLTPDARRAAIAAVALVMATMTPVVFGQIGAIGLGALAGFCLCRGETSADISGGLVSRISRAAGLAALGLFLALLVGTSLLEGATGQKPLAEFAAVYRSGALVFGGGHVVLPLLKDALVTPGYVDQGRFLAGYGAAQAVPGPLFSFAAYLGAIMGGGHPLAGAMLGLVAIFLPGLLILMAALPFWSALRRRPAAQAAMRGANAAVVGILAAALYDPVWTSAVRDRTDFAAAVVGFVLLTGLRAPPLVIVVLGAGFGLLTAG
jgi:chromate transporter